MKNMLHVCECVTRQKCNLIREAGKIDFLQFFGREICSFSPPITGVKLALNCS